MVHCYSDRALSERRMSTVRLIKDGDAYIIVTTSMLKLTQAVNLLYLDVREGAQSRNRRCLVLLQVVRDRSIAWRQPRGLNLLWEQRCHAEPTIPDKAPYRKPVMNCPVPEPERPAEKGKPLYAFEYG